MLKSKKEKSITLEEYILKGSYALVRKCNCVMQVNSEHSVWNLNTAQFKFLLEGLAEEFKPPEEKKNGKFAR